MFYFVQRGKETVQCEVRAASDGPGFEIVVTEADGAERVETFAISEQVHTRWLELHRRFADEGWWGPATQDGRG